MVNRVLEGIGDGSKLGLGAVAVGLVISVVVLGPIATAGVSALGRSFPSRTSATQPTHVESTLKISGGGEMIGL